jgi:trimethylamine--corrinoid protein Co-methyltransferase
MTDWGGKMKPLLKILSDEELEQIHAGALNLLREVGVSVQEEEAFSLFADAGAACDRRTRRVRIPEWMVSDALGAAPRTVVQCGRVASADLKLEGKRVHFRMGGGCSHLIDASTGKIKPAMTEDVARIAKLVDALPHVSSFLQPVLPADMPVEDQPTQLFRILTTNTAKHFAIITHSRQDARDVIEMASIVVGGMEELRRRPIISGIMQPTSPLQLDKFQLETLIEYAKRGLPVGVGSQQLMGATSPVTFAGTLAQAHAENLSGIVISQLIEKGTPVYYGTLASCMDMRTGNYASGAVERAMMAVAMIQLARYCGLPSGVGGGTSDSKVLDQQAAFDKVLTMLPPALAGTNMISGMGIVDNYNAASLEQLVIDNEIAGAIHRFVRGIEVDDDKMGLELIGKVGPGGHFMAQKHTLQYMMAELFAPQVADRRFRGEWERTGCKDVVQRAAEIVEEILQTHETTPLPEGVAVELDRFLASRGKDKS